MSRGAVREDSSLYARLGGGLRLQATVDGFYERVLSDPLRMPFFANGNLVRFRDRQVAFLAQALGGPATCRGPDLRRAHAHLGIGRTEFAAVCAHLIATLEAVQVRKALIDRRGGDAEHAGRAPRSRGAQR